MKKFNGRVREHLGATLFFAHLSRTQYMNHVDENAHTQHVRVGTLKSFIRLFHQGHELFGHGLMSQKE